MKIGDRVEVVRTHLEWNRFLRGMTGTIIEINPNALGKQIYKIQADNIGPLYDKVHHVWKVGDITNKTEDELKII